MRARQDGDAGAPFVFDRDLNRYRVCNGSLAYWAFIFVLYPFLYALFVKGVRALQSYFVPSVFSAYDAGPCGGGFPLHSECVVASLYPGVVVERVGFRRLVGDVFRDFKFKGSVCSGLADDVPGVDAVLRGDCSLFDAVEVPSSDSDGVLPDGCLDSVCPDYPHLSVCVVVFMG